MVGSDKMEGALLIITLGRVLMDGRGLGWLLGSTEDEGLFDGCVDIGEELDVDDGRDDSVGVSEFVGIVEG